MNSVMSLSVDFLNNPWKTLPKGASSKVKDIFEYLDKHPADVVGISMDYEPADIMLRRTARHFATTPAFGLKYQELIETEGAPSSHFAAVACGLLQLACGGLDECHAAVTPLSWDAPTLFGGEPVPDSPARADATFAHHLVHLREGGNPGEFGTGWNNSGFWAATLGRHPLFPQLAAAADQLCGGDEALRRRVRVGDGGEWDPRAFLRVCAEVERAGGGDAAAGWCRQMLNVQLRALLEHVWARF